MGILMAKGPIKRWRERRAKKRAEVEAKRAEEVAKIRAKKELFLGKVRGYGERLRREHQELTEEQGGITQRRSELLSRLEPVNKHIELLVGMSRVIEKEKESLHPLSPEWKRANAKYGKLRDRLSWFMHQDDDFYRLRKQVEGLKSQLSSADPSEMFKLKTQIKYLEEFEEEAIGTLEREMKKPFLIK